MMGVVLEEVMTGRIEERGVDKIDAGNECEKSMLCRKESLECIS